MRRSYFFAIALAALAQESEPAIRADVNLVPVTFSATDANEAPSRDLRRSELKLTDDQRPQTALRESIGRHELHQMVAEREMLGQELRRILDQKTNPWGISMQSVEIRDVQIPTALQDAMSREAPADRSHVKTPLWLWVAFRVIRVGSLPTFPLGGDYSSLTPQASGSTWTRSRFMRPNLCPFSASGSTDVPAAVMAPLSHHEAPNASHR
jgi:hypothetical protein